MSIDLFQKKYNLKKGDFLLVPYGSRVYGTESPKSDWDYMAIVKNKANVTTGEEFRHGDVNIHVYSEADWRQQLDRHKIHTLEAYFHPIRTATCGSCTSSSSIW